MPKANPRRIKSAPRVLLFTGYAVAAIVVGFFVLRPHQAAAPGSTVHIGKAEYVLEVASTEAQQEQGLGGRITMDGNKGMVFPYASVGQRCFWMKDMHFALDILWLDGNKRVSHIEPRVDPVTYPHAYCYDAQYVVELNAGETVKNQVRTGQMLAF